MIYIFHFLIVSILFIVFGRYKQTEKYFVVSSFLYVLFIFGQRWMTGTDFPNYLRYFITGFNGSERGYYSIQNFLSNNNFYFGILIFIILIITQINFYRFFLKFDSAATMLFVFLISEMFFAQMSQMRQYVAISFVINSLYHAYRKQRLKAVANIVLAGAFHSSAYFLIPLLIINVPFSEKVLKISKNKILTILGMTIVFPFIDITRIFTLPIFGRYSNYVYSQFNVPLGSAHYVKFFTMLSIFILYIFWIKELKNNRIDLFIINGVMLYIVLYGLSFHFAMLYRVVIFFQVFEIVFLVYYSNQLKNIPSYFSKRVVFLLFMGIFSFSALLDSYRVANYEFRMLRLYETRETEQLVYEIETFYD